MTTTIPARDWELTCHKCDGSGHVYVKHQVAERKTDIQEFKEECECCEGRGFVFAFQDIPGIEEYVKACRTASSAPGVSTVEDASFPSGAIVNGRVLADRLEAYPFESQGGDLRLCSDWVEFRRCFEYLAEWVGSNAPAAGDALDLTLAQKYEDACILANANARDAARWRDYAAQFPEISAAFLAVHSVDGGDPLPTIKGASITGGYVVVTPAGWDADKATKLRDAILRLFPVNPAHTPRPSDELAAQRNGDA